MKKQYLRVLMGLAGFAGFAIAAHGQAVDHVVVNIPYAFVAAGTTLPAGSYEVRRASNRPESRTLLLSSYNNRGSALVLPFEVENARDRKPQVSFQRVGNQFVLSKIQTAENVYAISISVPSPETHLALGKSHDGASGSGSPGSN